MREDPWAREAGIQDTVRAYEVAAATFSVVNATKGFKQMVAGWDCVFYEVPLENMHAVVETVEGQA